MAAEPILLFIGGTPEPAHREPSEMTVRQYARHEQVDERTVRRWIKKGALVVRQTPGGHFRIKGTR